MAVDRHVLADLDRPGDVFAHLTPNWFASVMGTGIVAVTASTLPIQFAGLHTFGVLVWMLATVLLLALLAAFGAHWTRHPTTARDYVTHPVVGLFYGALPMALLVVGASTLLLGRDVLGLRVAIDVDWVLWLAGTITGLATAIGVPVLFWHRRILDRDGAFAGWLMPVVPPMVASATGALLVPHAAAGPIRITVLVACYVMFATSGLVSAVIIVVVVRRIARDGAGEPPTVPTVWIALGPFGQSIAAADLLGAMSADCVSAGRARVLNGFGLGYGLVVWVLALLWAAVAVRLTAQTVRHGMPFTLAWWSFTFPVGTFVSGTSALAEHTGWELFRGSAVVFFACLVTAWALVAVRTARGCLRGRLFLPPAQQAAAAP